MSTPETLAANELHLRQQAISAALIREILELLAAILVPTDMLGTWPILRRSLLLLIRSRRMDSANEASASYMKMRAAAGVVAPFEPSKPRDFAEERVSKALDSAGPAVMRKALASGASREQARDRMATTLTGTASRLVLEAGRDVIEASVQDDEDALGWARVGDGDPCSWCAMLLSRGIVYKSAKTAGDTRYGGEKYHDHDGCQAVPVWDPDSPIVNRADALYAEWKQATSGHSGKDAVNVWRRYWDARAEE